MAVEVSYVLITPYCLFKSRTGGIIARLMSRTDLEFIGAQVLAFTPEAAEAYGKALRDENGIVPHWIGEVMYDYVRSNFSSREDGRKERSLMLLFRGEDACAKLTEVAGRLSTSSSPRGESIRDTYADMVEDKEHKGVIRYFEPAVFTPPNSTVAKLNMRIFADFAANQPNIVDNAVGFEAGEERTLVIIKPDNWRHPSSRPGNIIDMISRTGLRIVGCKVHRMSVADALDFYGPVRNALHKKLAPKIAEKAKNLLEKQFGIELPESALDNLRAAAGLPFADDQFGQLIEFMSGRRPENLTEAELHAQNDVKCLILIYEGKDAIAKIRTVLGPTDPSQAPGGTVRRDFGSDVMVNTVHASDAPESVIREMKIVRINENSMCSRINEYLNQA